MKIIYPFKKKGVNDFRLESSLLEDWLVGGKYHKYLFQKKIFYIVQFNNLKPSGNEDNFKIGVDLKPSRRFASYYNHAGKNDPKNNPCSGGYVKFICGTDWHRDDNKIQRKNNQVYQLEYVVKKDLKPYVQRGTEWLLINPKKLMEIVKSHFIKVDSRGDVYTISKYKLRTPTGKDIYEVEKILDKKKIKSLVYYKVKWKDYDKNKATWEPYANLKGSTALIREYNKNNN